MIEDDDRTVLIFAAGRRGHGSSFDARRMATVDLVERTFVAMMHQGRDDITFRF